MPNVLLAFCLDFSVVIWHFVCINFLWHFVRIISLWLGILSESQTAEFLKNNLSGEEALLISLLIADPGKVSGVWMICADRGGWSILTGLEIWKCTMSMKSLGHGRWESCRVFFGIMWGILCELYISGLLKIDRTRKGVICWVSKVQTLDITSSQLNSV